MMIETEEEAKKRIERWEHFCNEADRLRRQLEYAEREILRLSKPPEGA